MSDDNSAEIVSVEAMQMVDAAEVDMQVATAKKYERSIKRFREKVLELATIDQQTAEECWYALPRGGKVIEGPGIRFAEIVAASYGNLRAASRHIKTDEKSVTCEGVCWDLENNVAVKSTVNRRITRRNGQRFDEDMINVTIAAANAIALRNAVFKVVPKAIFQKSLEEVKKIAMGSGRTITEVRKAIVEHFKGMGVKIPQILAVVGKKGVEDLTLEDATTLRGVATAIKEGTTTLAEVFSAERAAPQRTAVPKEKVKAASAEAHTHPGEAHKEEKPKKKKAKAKPKVDPVEEARANLKGTIEKVAGDVDEDVIADQCWMAGVTEGIDKCDDVDAMNQLADKLLELATGG